jgi:hypothetical protein
VRAFVVGTGPSLTHTNLDLLIGETSFGVNRVAGIYPKTKWRPTHYVRAEEAGIGSNPLTYRYDIELHCELGCEIWANEFFIGELPVVRNSGQYRQIRGCAHYNMHFDNPDCPPVYHMPRLCILNFDEVYLIGCDLGYLAGDVHHFDPDYTKGVGLLREPRYTELDILQAHMIAARSFPGRIFNATIGGSLEVYPRVNYESLFS